MAASPKKVIIKLSGAKKCKRKVQPPKKPSMDGQVNLNDEASIYTQSLEDPALTLHMQQARESLSKQSQQVNNVKTDEIQRQFYKIMKQYSEAMKDHNDHKLLAQQITSDTDAMEREMKSLMAGKKSIRGLAIPPTLLNNQDLAHVLKLLHKKINIINQNIETLALYIEKSESCYNTIRREIFGTVEHLLRPKPI